MHAIAVITKAEVIEPTTSALAPPYRYPRELGGGAERRDAGPPANDRIEIGPDPIGSPRRRLGRNLRSKILTLRRNRSRRKIPRAA